MFLNIKNKAFRLIEIYILSKALITLSHYFILVNTLQVLYNIFILL